jgi:hypothetical protein
MESNKKLLTFVDNYLACKSNELVVGAYLHLYLFECLNCTERSLLR